MTRLESLSFLEKAQKRLEEMPQEEFEKIMRESGLLNDLIVEMDMHTPLDKEDLK